MLCPRRIEDGAIPGGPFLVDREGDKYIEDRCSYCGSFSEDFFMGLIQDGKVSITPTDKNYKVYVSGDGVDGKFYFQHLSPENQKKFKQIHDSGTLRIEYPGYLYVKPFFM